MELRNRAVLATTAASLALAGCSITPPERGAEAAGSIAMSPQQIVAGRQAAFRLSAANFQLMRTAAEKGADLKSFAGPARSLAQWAKALPGMFPAGTGPGVANTRAHAEIWANRADFEQKAAAYAAAAARLGELAEAGNMGEALKQWDMTWRSCGACHDLYRSEVPGAR